MARSKRKIDGWVILDKPLNMTSTQAVGKVRWLFGAEKAGHAGTLDPLANGLLPIALGEATKTVPYVQDGRKRYRFAIAWGSETATDDAEGAVVARSDQRPDLAAVQAALPDFTGTILQKPPAFSAILVDGERAYDLARAGKIVDLPARPVVIEALTLISHGPELSEFEMACEKGTYVRSLARDLARALGTVGHVAQLRRVAVGSFAEADAVTLDTLEAAADRDALLTPIGRALRDVPEVRVAPDEAALIRNGGAVLLRGRDAPIQLAACWASCGGAAVAVGTVHAGQFAPSRVLRS